MNAATRCRALVLTLGTTATEPWWYSQIEASGLRGSIHHERVLISGRQQSMGIAAIWKIAIRLARLIGRARSEGIEYIFTFEGDLSCYLVGLLQRWPNFQGPRHVILQFITRERDPSPRSRVRHSLASFCLRTVHRFICSSRRESTYYAKLFGNGEERFLFVPFHTDSRLLEHSPLPPGDYLVAAGRSYRDYSTLAAAVAGTGLRTIVVCGRAGAGLSNLPVEIEVVTEMPFDQLMRLVAGARLVVLPLEPRQISTGQSVLLQAMALGRTTISTRTAGTEDYIVEGESGFLVPPRDPGSLRTIVMSLWNDDERLMRVGLAARMQVRQHHLPAQYVRDIATALGCHVPR